MRHRAITAQAITPETKRAKATARLARVPLSLGQDLRGSGMRLSEAGTWQWRNTCGQSVAVQASRIRVLREGGKAPARDFSRCSSGKAPLKSDPPHSPNKGTVRCSFLLLDGELRAEA